MVHDTKQAKSKIESHSKNLIKYVENYFDDLKNKRQGNLENFNNIEAEVKNKMELIQNFANQIKEKNEGILVEERLEEIEKLLKWSQEQIENLQDSTKFENLNQKIRLDANLTVKNPTDLQETIYEEEDVISTCIVFFGEFSRIVGYRPDIDYWFTGKSNMESTDSSNQFLYTEGMQASLIFHNKIIFTGN
jgi:hypothetical protein